MKIWVVEKYRAVEVEAKASYAAEQGRRADDGWRYRERGPSYALGQWWNTEAEAQVAADAARTKRIASLKKQLASLEKAE